ncbi:MAG: insH [Nitrospira sp.]|nr:insH [Nitrospira sp.]
MKAHIGVASRTKLIHSVAATAAHVHDSQVLPDLLHGQETRVWGDAAYSGHRAVIQHHAPEAKSCIQTKAPRHRPLSETERARTRTKSKVRAKVEHVFLVMKRIFGWAKVRYRGRAKNTDWLFVTCGLTKLYLARRRLLSAGRPRAGGRWMSPTKSSRTSGYPPDSPLGDRSRSCLNVFHWARVEPVIPYRPCPSILKRAAAFAFIARIERAQLYRTRSASKKDGEAAPLSTFRPIIPKTATSLFGNRPSEASHGVFPSPVSDCFRSAI